MKAESILQADVLDILFEHRNKQYGAYDLRKFYNNRLYRALGGVVVLTVIIFLLSFLPGSKAAITAVEYETDPVLVPPPKDQPKPEKPAEVQPQRPATAANKPLQKALTNFLITPDDQADSRDSTLFGNVPVPGVKGPVVADPGPYDPGPVAAPPVAPEIPPVDIVTPSAFAEVMPTFPGGNDALRKFLEKNLRNPADMDAGQGVDVKIRFVVGYDGSLKSFETVQDGGNAFNNEVMRVLKKMPKWIPGKTRGENVSVYYTVPVHFITYE